jgi:hypothetical protein
LGGEAGAATSGRGPTSSRFSAAELAVFAPKTGQEGRIGPVLDALTVAEGVARTPTAVQARAAQGQRLIAGGQLGMLDPGAYELVIDLQVRTLADPGPIAVLALMGHAGLIAEQVLEVQEPGRARATLAFDADAEAWRGTVVLIKAQGTADFDVVDLVLR